MRKIQEIILHCTANKVGTSNPLNIIKYHVEHEKWKYCGYHYIVDYDGTVYATRPLEEEGAHCFGHNQNSIGIAYMGGLDVNGYPCDTRTREQKVAILWLIYRIQACIKIDIKNIRCHNEFSNKACPCFTKQEFDKEYKFFDQYGTEDYSTLDLNRIIYNHNEI